MSIDQLVRSVVTAIVSTLTANPAPVVMHAPADTFLAVGAVCNNRPVFLLSLRSDGGDEHRSEGRDFSCRAWLDGIERSDLATEPCAFFARQAELLEFWDAPLPIQIGIARTFADRVSVPVMMPWLELHFVSKGRTVPACMTTYWILPDQFPSAVRVD